MKILAFTDLHGDKKAIEKVLEKSKEADILVCCGDITDFNFSLEKFIGFFKNINKNIVLIPGNHESEKQIIEICDKYNFVINVHLRRFKFGEFVFFGFGMGGFSKEDYELEDKMKKIKFGDMDKIIFISHGPPYGTKLDYLDGLGYRGSITLTKFIKTFKPEICFCGHLHENFNKEDKIGETLIINPGKFGRIITI